MKKKKVSKPCIRVKEYESGWQSSTWTKSGVDAYPAWRATGKVLRVDLFKGMDYRTFTIHQDAKVIALFVGRIINKYLQDGKFIDKDISKEILQKIDKYIDLTSDMMEKL